MTGGELLRRTVRRHGRRLALGTAMLSGHQAAEALVPVAIGLVIDRAVATGDVVALVVSVVGLAALFLGLAMAWRFGARQTVYALESEGHQLRVEVARRALDPRGHSTGMRSGELLSVASSDIERATLITRVVAGAVASVVALGVSAVALLAIDVWLGVGVLVGVPLLVSASQALAPLMTRRSADQQESAAGTTALATDLVAGLRTLRGVGAQHNAADRYRRSSAGTLAVTLRAATTSGLYEGVTTALGGLLLAAVAGFAGWFALSGRLTIGELVAVVGLAQFISEPVRGLGMCGQMLAMARASADRIAGVLSSPPAVEHGDKTTSARPTIELRGVSYRTLDAVDLHVTPGELVGVVAYDPRDAEALLALLAGRVLPADHTGSVLVDGVPVTEVDIDALRATVLVEPHDVSLFEGTLRGNIAAGRDTTDAAVHAAISASASGDIVEAHPDGLDRPMTDRGLTLSGGQRQRVGLARALHADPPVLVLHDPTTAVDSVTEERVAAGLAEARAGRTTLVLTTSPTLLGRAARVVVVQDGRIARTGTHADLTDDETYRRMVLR